MLTIKLKTYQTIVLIAAAIFIIFIIFRGCNAIPLNTVDKKSFDSLLVAKKVSEAESGKVIDSIFKENNRRAVKNSLDSIALVRKDQQLEITTLTAKALAKEVKLYAAYKDTVAQLKAAPLLADQVIDLVEQVDSFRIQTRVLRNSLDSSVGATSLIISQKDYQLSSLQDQFSFISKKYLKLDNNYNSINKKLKRERTLSRILGIGVLVAGGIILTK